MRVNKYLLPLIVIATLLGTVAAARATGYWQTSGRQMVNLKEGIHSSEIKGWMTLRDVSQGTGVPVDQLRLLLGLAPDTPESLQMRELEGLISVREVRAILGAYLSE
jgi:hypothetical protein